MFYWVFSCKNSILYHPSYKKRVKKSWIIINHKDSTVYPNVVYKDGLNREFSGSVLRLGFQVRANPKHHYNILASDAKKCCWFIAKTNIKTNIYLVGEARGVTLWTVSKKWQTLSSSSSGFLMWSLRKKSWALLEFFFLQKVNVFFVCRLNLNHPIPASFSVMSKPSFSEIFSLYNSLSKSSL